MGKLVIESQERPVETPSKPTLPERLRRHPVTVRFVAYGIFFRDRLHERVRSHPVLGGPYRVLVVVIGVVVVLLGLVLVPAPGPGWLIVIAGLGVLSTEFPWAQRLLHFTRGAVAGWTQWVLRQPLAFRMLFGALGLVLLVAGVLTSLKLSGWTGFPFS